MTTEKTKTPVDYFSLYFNNYFGDKYGAADVLWLTTNGAVWHESCGCHGVFNQFPGNSNVYAVYSSLRCRYEDLYDAACEYWDYLLNPDISPFKLALKKVERVVDAKGRPIAFGLLDMDVPSQMAVPLMMQCRVPQEFSNKLRAFKAFRANGFSLPESLYLSEVMMVTATGAWTHVYDGYYHAFDKRYLSFKRIRDCDPLVDLSWGFNPARKMNSQSREGGYFNYGPVSGCWMPTNRRPGTTRPVWLSQMRGDRQPYTGSFPEAFKKQVDIKLEFPLNGTELGTEKGIMDWLSKNKDKWQAE